MPLILNIGRQADNDIVMSESFISAHHAQLIQDADGKWFINDLKSTNGTFVNGIRVLSTIELKEEDEVVLGGSMLPWKDIYQRYKKPGTKPVSFSSYILGAAAAVVIVVALYFLNEYIPANPSKNSSAVNKPPKSITYDFSCITLADNKKINSIATKLDSAYSNYVDKLGVTVTLEDEIDFGDKNHEAFLKGGKVLENNDTKHLRNILSQLVSRIPEPRGFSYKFFLVQSDEVNSWTSGGRIYFTTAMLAFTKNDDEIAGILGHEINHNELYHINKKLKVEKAAEDKFGSTSAGTISAINNILTAPFGKKDEVYCDLKGIDIIIAAGFNPCEVIKLWKRMAEQEGEYDPFSNFIRSHPYSANRVDCIKHHLQVNYNIDCNNY